MRTARAFLFCLLLPGAAAAANLPDRAAAVAALAGEPGASAAILLPGVVVFCPGGTTVTGREAVERDPAARAALAALAGARLRTVSFDATGPVAVENGIIEGGKEAGATYAAVWRRDAGAWKLDRFSWSRDGAPPVPAPPAAPPPAPAPPPSAPPIALPEPRPLSDGLIREVSDEIHRRARRLRKGADGARAKEAATYLRGQIEDIGWIDLARFGWRIECDAAYIAARSRDRSLIELVRPWVDRDLRNSYEGGACYQETVRAFDAALGR